MAIHMHKKLPVILTTVVIAVRFLSIDVVTSTAGDHASVWPRSPREKYRQNCSCHCPIQDCPECRPP